MESRIPEFLKALEEMKDLHIKKNADYASAENPFSNFDVSSYLGSLFDSDRDKAFAILIGTKLGRLSSLLNSKNSPNNESVRDSFIDGANYLLLWMSDYLRRQPIPLHPPNFQADKRYCTFCNQVRPFTLTHVFPHKKEALVSCTYCDKFVTVECDVTT